MCLLARVQCGGFCLFICSVGLFIRVFDLFCLLGMCACLLGLLFVRVLLVGRLVVCLVGWLFVRCVAWLAGGLVGWSCC